MQQLCSIGTQNAVSISREREREGEREGRNREHSILSKIADGECGETIHSLFGTRYWYWYQLFVFELLYTLEREGGQSGENEIKNKSSAIHDTPEELENCSVTSRDHEVLTPGILLPANTMIYFFYYESTVGVLVFWLVLRIEQRSQKNIIFCCRNFTWEV